jgi:hypothetical protein
MNLKLMSQPETDDAIAGTEPWDLPGLLKLLDKKPEAAAGDMLGCVDKMKMQGPVSLTREQRSFWLSYQEAAKSPLPPAVNVAVALEQAHIDNALSALSKATEDVKGLESTMEQTEHSLVSRMNNIGLFAKRGPIRLLALPDWVQAAICVNTKARYWEIITVSHHKIIQLPLLVSALVAAEWAGHRYRVRTSGLPDMRSIQSIMYSLSANIRANQ